jgi:hypothetical protein
MKPLRSVSRYVLVCVLALVVGCNAAAASPASRSTRDGAVVVGKHFATRLGPLGLRTVRTLADAIAAFGKPDTDCAGATHNSTRFHCSWGKWGLRAVIAQSAENGNDADFESAVLTGRAWHTSQGLRVGASVARLRHVYPKAMHHGHTWIIRTAPACTSDHATTVAATVAHRRVVSLFTWELVMC